MVGSKANFIPISYQTSNTATESFQLSKDYILNTLFPVSQHALIQGMLSYKTVTDVYEAKLNAVFATSHVWYQVMILAIAVLVSAISTIFTYCQSSYMRVAALRY